MPKRKRSYSKKSSRRTKTRKTRKRTRAMVQGMRKPVKGFPKSQLVEMTYCDEITVPNVDAGSAPYKFRLNSIFDPDFTSTGHQPRGHDQWQVIYNKYCVIGATAKVEPLWAGPGETGADTSVTLYGYVDDDNTSDNYDVKELVELNMPKATHKFVTIGTNSRVVNTYPRSRNLNFKISMKKFFGVSKGTQIMAPRQMGVGDATYANNPYDLSATFGQNPGNVAYLKLHCDAQNPLGDEAVLKARVTIKYLVVCHDPREVGLS